MEDDLQGVEEEKSAIEGVEDWLDDWLGALLLVIAVSTLANTVMLMYFLRH